MYATLPPGEAEAPPSLLVIARSGCAFSGVVSLAVLLAGTGSGRLEATLAVFAICVAPAGTVAFTVTAKLREPPPDPLTSPTPSVQVLPALLLGTQAQPGELAPALNVVSAGTTSVSTTLGAPKALRFE